jgi:hypothetical protein
VVVFGFVLLIGMFVGTAYMMDVHNKAIGVGQYNVRGACMQSVGPVENYKEYVDKTNACIMRGGPNR